ncbi:disease resistance protein RPM1-like [Humulus lupulus]|uniref:disease resistance protein RPM1-like n=1 Tax=Humulus lupulus TaxID=3486 RepID=UPI002B40C44D|nr:disease resistance protein RPM1-like [Humulus lupulus]
MTFRYFEKNLWIKREWRLLDALSEDFRKAYRTVNQIKERANQVWESELNLGGITLTLSEAETRWVKKTGKVGICAKTWAEELEKLLKKKRDGGAAKSLVLVLRNVRLIFELAYGIFRTKGEITVKTKFSYGIFRTKGEMTVKAELQKIVKKINFTNHIIKSVEESRTKLSTLQDRPIDDTEHLGYVPAMLHVAPVVPFVLERMIVETPNHLIRGKKMVNKTRSILLQMQLLEPYMRDLRGLKMESNMEKAWLEEAMDTNIQVRNDINIFLQEASNQNQNFFSDWILRRKLKQIVKRVDRELSHLLQLKETYGFNFIRRVPSKGYARMIRPLSQQQTSIKVLMEDILGQLRMVDERSQISEGLRKGLSDEFTSVWSKLSNLEANEGATNTRMACFEILKKMLEVMQELLKDDREATGVLRRIASLKLVKKMASIIVSSRESRRTKQLMDTAKLLNKCIHSYRIKVMDESCSVFGLEEDIHKLVLKLTTNDSNDGSIISIVGMRGTGKTTLAKIIYNHRSIVNRFGERCLVSMRKEYYSDNNLLLKGVGNQIMRTKDESSESHYWAEEIRNFLREKRCLIVLDDLSSMEAWDLLRQVLILREMAHGSMIMLTTCSKEIAAHASIMSTSIHKLRLRTKEESWNFLTQMVQCPADPEVELLAKKVVARTGGLPLAILRLGYLLSGKKVTSAVLSRVLVRVSQGDQNQSPWIEIKDMNKNDYLHAQPSTDVDKCLSYFELFPRDFEIPVRRLVALWVAQGLVGQTTHEKKAYDLLLELIDRNMIQIVTKKNNGEVKTCRFPSILREVWLQGRRKNMNSLSWSLYTSLDRQVAYHFDDKEASDNNGGVHGLDSDTVSKHDGYPFSIMVFDNREGAPGEDIRLFLRMGIRSGRFHDLVVLDLEGLCGPNLSRTIGKLKKLKYLGLRRTELKTLPSTICKLVHLQTLDLKHTRLEKVPVSIWKLKKLQCLYLDRSCRFRSSHISMKNLQILSAFLDHGQGKDIALMNELHKLNNLRKLRLTLIQWTEPQQQQLATCLRQLTHLNSLSLKSVDENMLPQDLVLGNCFKDLTNLSKLYLSGKLLPLDSNTTLPESLIEVTLAKSQLSGLESSVLMGKLAALPLLNILNFRSKFCCEPEMIFPDGFPKLLVLKLWDLDQLVKLVVKKEAMQKLRELEIRCAVLKHTTGLTNLKTLQELKLTDMEEKLVQAIENEFLAANNIIYFTSIIRINSHN